MGLEIVFTGVKGIDEADSWVVAASHVPRKKKCPRAFLWGFARKADAEIAVKLMQKTNIDWNAPVDELRRQWNEFGGREAMKKYVCEHLQW